MHQSQQSSRLRSSGRWVVRKNATQPDGFVAEFPANCLVRIGGKVTLREQEIKNQVHRFESRPNLFMRNRVCPDGKISQTVVGPFKTLVDIRFGSEEPKGNLFHVEATKRFESQRQLRFHGDYFIAAHE